MTARRRPADPGFTLIEMIVTVSLLAVVGVAVFSALFVGIRATSDSHRRIEQSLTEMEVTRFLSGDIYAAEGPVIVNSASDMSCGGVAPLKLSSRSTATAATLDTTVVWVLHGTDLVRRTCVNGAQTDEFVVTEHVSAFTPAACAAPCTSRSISVTFTAAADGRIDAQSWTLSVARRGATS
jgi:prepilin-type N-terminal cleavage/methylation domain-containing protein